MLKQIIKAPPTLEQDDYDLEVAILQRLLVFYEYLPGSAVDGSFDFTTDNAVRQFQHDNALYKDGIVGPYTWTALADLN
jgi:peptidoglycan hydrolase-like protein with peptidoglycan-binding domain